MSLLIRKLQIVFHSSRVYSRRWKPLFAVALTGIAPDSLNDRFVSTYCTCCVALELDQHLDAMKAAGAEYASGIPK